MFKRKLSLLLALLLIVIVAVALLVAINLSYETPRREFYVGVEIAYGDQASDVIALVDRVKDFTNLFVIGSVELTFNRTALDEACDYIYQSKLNFIVMFTSSSMYNESTGFSDRYRIFEWMRDAQDKYGEQFLGIYRYDEPGGHQIDGGPSMLIENASSYEEVSRSYVGNLSSIVNFYLNYAPQVVTSDYGLYWFDYKASYSSVFAEFVWNESRQRHIAMGRGAATAFNKDWGVIVTWKYDAPPYLESGDELYDDLVLAYSAGAKYAVVFSYPVIGPYGTLTEEHFEALEKFWQTLQSNPASFGTNKPEAAYILPRDYGFGLRRPDDRIWGIFPPDELSPKIYNDVNLLLERYGARLDILYDEPEVIEPLLSNYRAVYYYYQTIT